MSLLPLNDPWLPLSGQLNLQESTPPPNDDLSNATAITSLPFSDSLDTTAATVDDNDPIIEDCAGQVLNTVWYRYTAAEDGVVKLDTTASDYSTVIAAFTGEPGALEQVGCDSYSGPQQNRAFLLLPTQSGQDYYILVAGEFGTSGGQLELSVDRVHPPIHDDFSNAITFSSLPFEDHRINALATEASDDPSLSCYDPPSGLEKTVWYEFQATETGGIKVLIPGSDHFPAMAAWQGSRGSLSEITCTEGGRGYDNEATGEFIHSYLSFPVTAGETYWIEVAAPDDGPETGVYWLRAENLEPPANDDIESAELIVTFDYTGYHADLALATTEISDPTPSCGASSPAQQSHSVWYRFEPSETQPISYSFYSEFPMVAALWSGEIGSLQEEACAVSSFNNVDDSYWLQSGETYWLEIARFGSGNAGLINYYFSTPTPPVNDDVSQAETIDALPFTDFLNTVGATSDPDDPIPSCGAASPPTQSNSVWYQFTPTEDLKLNLTAADSDYETVSALWTGSPGSLTEIACVVHGERLGVDLLADTTYHIEVMQRGDPGGGRLWLELREGLTTGCQDNTCIFPVVQGSDDAGSVPQAAPASCVLDTGNDNIYLGVCENGDPMTSGLRFQNVTLPPNAIINEAYVEFVRDGPYDNGLELEIYGEASAQPQTFSSTDRPEQRTSTSSTVPWIIPTSEEWVWRQIGRTPDITPIIQEILDLPDWQADNPVAIIITNTGPVSGTGNHRRFYGYDRAVRDFTADPPRLIVKLGGIDPDRSSVTLSSDAILADGVEAATATVSLVDSSGNPVPDHQVSLAISPHLDLLINGEPATETPYIIGITDSSGQISASLQGTQAGLKTITAIDETEQVTLTDQPVLELQPGPPDPTTSSVRSVDQAPADGATEVEVVVTVRDAYHNRIPNVEVVLEPSGDAIVTQPAGTTDANGQTRGYMVNGTSEVVLVQASAGEI
ncbi:MAG: Ig-like domain-containing protein, partial [Anaerolineales bacterium]